MLRKIGVFHFFAILALIASSLTAPTSAQAAANTSPVVQVTPGCALLADGNMDCWIRNATYGFQSTQPSAWYNGVARTMQTKSRISQISDSCYILFDQSVACANDTELVPIGINAISISKANQDNLFGPACAVTTANDVVCWRGDWSTKTFLTPVAVGISGASQVAVGRDGSGCALLLDGSLQCWGALSSSGSATPSTIDIYAGHKITSIAATWTTACATADDATVWCWGDDSGNQTGQPVPNGSGSSLIYQAPAQVAGISGATGLSLGSFLYGGQNDWGVDVTSCANTNAGEVYCWGASSFGANGLNGGGSTATPQLVAFPNGLTAAQVSTNEQNTCALLSDGGVYCWGNGYFPNCGQNNCFTPTLVSAAADLPDAPFQPTLTSASYANGVVSASWIPTSDTNSPDSTAYQVSARFSGATTSIVEMSSTSVERCAVLSDGKVACWGTNFYFDQRPVGRFGTSATRYSNTPVYVPGVQNAVQVVLGIDFACALLSDASVTCWGLNNNGQLGRGNSPARNDYTIQTAGPAVGLPADITEISAREGGICALSGSGSIYCWGQTARGTFNTPTLIPGITNAVKVTYGNDWVCAVLADATVDCWGWGRNGTFADGSVDYTSDPKPVLGLTRVSDVQVLDRGACALQVDGAVLCWGNNSDGALGDGTTTDSMAPQLVTGIPKASVLASNEHGACISDASEQTYCWGWINNAPTALSPVRVAQLDGSLALSGGFYSQCGLGHTGEVSCVGGNSFGEAGTGAYGYTGQSSLMTHDVTIMCETTALTCDLETPPGATSVTVSVQAFNPSGQSADSNSQTLSIAAPTAVTQLQNATLQASTAQAISLSAASTDPTATIKYSTTTPGCTVTGTTVTSTTPVICDVVATSTSQVAAPLGITALGGAKVAASENKSHSTKAKFLFVGSPQTSALAITATVSANTVTLSTTGGSGTGVSHFFTTSPGCTLNGSTLSVVGLTKQSCVVLAKKEGDATYDSTLSAQTTIVLNDTFDTPRSTENGFKVNLKNYDATTRYSATVTVGKVTLGRAAAGLLPITVQGLKPGQLAGLAITLKKQGLADRTLQLSAGSIAPKVAVVLAKASPLVGGFLTLATRLNTSIYN